MADFGLLDHDFCSLRLLVPYDSHAEDRQPLARPFERYFGMPMRQNVAKLVMLAKLEQGAGDVLSRFGENPAFIHEPSQVVEPLTGQMANANIVVFR